MIVVFADHTHLLFFIDTLLGKGKELINFGDLDLILKVIGAL